MKLVVDANIIFAALIKEGVTAEILAKRDDLYTPEFFFEELSGHYEELHQKTHREDFLETIEQLRSRVRVITVDASFVRQALNYTPDPKDVAYIALALQLECALWSNDKRLQGCGIRVITTTDLTTFHHP